MHLTPQPSPLASTGAAVHGRFHGRHGQVLRALVSAFEELCAGLSARRGPIFYRKVKLATPATEAKESPCPSIRPLSLRAAGCRCQRSAAMVWSSRRLMARRRPLSPMNMTSSASPLFGDCPSLHVCLPLVPVVPVACLSVSQSTPFFPFRSVSYCPSTDLSVSSCRRRYTSATPFVLILSSVCLFAPCRPERHHQEADDPSTLCSWFPGRGQPSETYTGSLEPESITQWIAGRTGRVPLYLLLVHFLFSLRWCMQSWGIHAQDNDVRIHHNCLHPR